jgi:hypothetical protein
MNTGEKYWIPIIVLCIVLFFIKPVLCFLSAGILGFCYVAFSSLHFKKIQNKGIECTGKIVSYQVTSSGYKTPVIEFNTLDGQTVIATPYVYMSAKVTAIRFHDKIIDNEVLVAYDPNNPKKFILKNATASNYLAIILGSLICLAFIMLSICSLLGYIDVF